MLEFCDKNKGAISVFLTLILLPVLLLGGLTIDAARIYTSKVMISDAGEMAMNAGLAQYEERLHDEYGLFVMATAPDSMQEELRTYFEKSLNGTGLPGEEDYDQILGLIAKQFEAINLDGSQIYKTEVEKQQIIEYMKYRAPICLTELVLEKMEKLKKTKKMAEAMMAELEFAETMEESQEAMEEAKKALDKLNNLILIYPWESEIEEELQSTEQDYKVPVSRSLIMLAAISKYDQMDSRDAKACAESYIQAAQNVRMDDENAIWSSFEQYMNSLYYRAGEENAEKRLSQIVEEHAAKEPEEDGPEYSEWKEQMDELNDLRDAYESAKGDISGYPNKLREIANASIVDHTEKLYGFLELSALGEEFSRDSYKKLEIVKKKLERAKEKWIVWSDKTDALGDDAGGMKESVDEYGKFFGNGDPQNDMNNLEALMEIVKTDRSYFAEMKEILQKEKLFGQSIASIEPQTQYSVYYSQADAAVGNNTNLYSYIEDIRQSYIKNYEHTRVTPVYGRISMDSSAFYEKLKEYCQTVKSNEAEAERQKVDTDLKQCREAAQEAEKAAEERDSGYAGYKWDKSSLPSTILGTEAEEAKRDYTDLDGSVGSRNGRKNAISRFKASIGAASSFMDGLDRILADNLENLYVAEYAMQMFSYYTVNKEDGTVLNDKEILGLSGFMLKEHKPYGAEVEYILWGDEDSAVNVRNTMMLLFGIRLLFNSFFAFTDTGIVASAKTSATAIVGWWAPYLIPVVQVIIQLAAAGVETVDDMMKLKNGYAVTVIKSRVTWATAPYARDNTLGLTLDYSEYLRIFLNINMLDEQKKNYKLGRIADCIQVNSGFNMLEGYTMLAVEVKIGVKTLFMKRISDTFGEGWGQPDNSYTVLYQSVLGY